DAGALSSPDGGSYAYRARLEKNGLIESPIELPVRYLWAVRPLALPAVVTAGTTYSVDVEWEELPSYLTPPTPLSRADLWESVLANAEHYLVGLQLYSSNTLIVSSNYLTSAASGTNRF